MKTFRHKLGHFAGKTMTILDLRLKLCKYPEDMPVMVNFEGCDFYIDQEDDYFEVEKLHKGHPDDECDVLVIKLYEY